MDGWWTVAAGIPTAPWVVVGTEIGGYHDMVHAVIVAPEPILRFRSPPPPGQNRKFATTTPLTARTVLMDGERRGDGYENPQDADADHDPPRRRQSKAVG